jgi:hypothetical protein
LRSEFTGAVDESVKKPAKLTVVKIDQYSKGQGSILNSLTEWRSPAQIACELIRQGFLRTCQYQHFEELRGEIMKSLVTCAGALCVAAVCLVVPEASALALAPEVPKTGSSLTIAVMLAAVVLCLVIGVVLRAFSKPPAELSLNQRTK